MDDLPRTLSRTGGGQTGEDFAESLDAVDSRRDTELPDAGKLMDDAPNVACEGEGRGDGSALST